jgi:hypothetical protein
MYNIIDMPITVKHKRNNTYNSKPNLSAFEYGEIAIRYSNGDECIFIKNDNDEIVEFRDKNYYDKRFQEISNHKVKTIFYTDSVTLYPNVYYVQDAPTTNLTIYIGKPEDETILNEYLIEFTTSSNGTTISIPSSIKWANGKTPTFENDSTYQISIVNNLGVCLKFK